MLNEEKHKTQAYIVQYNNTKQELDQSVEINRQLEVNNLNIQFNIYFKNCCLGGQKRFRTQTRKTFTRKKRLENRKCTNSARIVSITPRT